MALLAVLILNREHLDGWRNEHLVSLIYNNYDYTNRKSGKQ